MNNAAKFLCLLAVTNLFSSVPTLARIISPVILEGRVSGMAVIEGPAAPEISSQSLALTFHPAGLMDVVSTMTFKTAKAGTYSFKWPAAINETVTRLDGKKRRVTFIGRRGTQLRTQFVGKFKVKALKSGEHELVSTYSQPLEYRHSFYEFEYDLSTLDLGKLASMAKLRISAKISEKYLDFQLGKFSCSLAKRAKDGYDTLKRAEVSGIAARREGKLVYQAETDLTFEYNVLICQLDGGPTFSPQALATQKKVRAELEAQAAKLVAAGKDPITDDLDEILKEMDQVPVK